MNLFFLYFSIIQSVYGISILFLLLLTFYKNNFKKGESTFDKLTNSLFSNYNVNSRPVFNYNLTSNISLYFKLFQILESVCEKHFLKIFLEKIYLKIG